MILPSLRSVTIGAAILSLPTFIFADVIRISQADFTADAGLITFSEMALGSVNPVYTPAMYGADPSGVTVSFGGYYIGQGIGGSLPGANPTGVITGAPTGTLTLDPTAPAVFTVMDGANPTSPVLSGSPIFNGAVTMLFDKDIAGVGLEGGYFNAIGGTAITAFDRSGNVIGQVSNTGLGIEFLGLVTEDGQNGIAGLQFGLVGPEPAGFAIDNLRFGFADQIKPPDSVPEPSVMALFGLGLVSLAGIAKKRKHA